MSNGGERRTANGELSGNVLCERKVICVVVLWGFSFSSFRWLSIRDAVATNGWAASRLEIFLVLAYLLLSLPIVDTLVDLVPGARALKAKLHFVGSREAGAFSQWQWQWQRQGLDS